MSETDNQKVDSTTAERIEKIKAKIGDTEFGFNAVDASKGGPFVEAYDMFTSAASQAWMILELTNPGFSQLSDHQKVGAMVNGTIAGVIAMVMSRLKPEYAGKAAEYVKNCVEPASFNAEDLVKRFHASVAEMARQQDGCTQPADKLN
jgi:hypothetical protein